MITELLTAATCCVGVATMPAYNLPSQCEFNRYHIESKNFDLSNTTQTIALNLDEIIKENIKITKKYSVKDLESIFGIMTGFTKEENDYFWNKIEEKSTIIEGIEVI